ncbi:tetratricopeptide repeat protein [Aphanothece sacrum]|uniref:tetratricopeptide repeat protein n=1 Tax=Aphanothece sacrum TaxID=1122 RepID=UPI0015620CD1|nr:tetratricopeptide repeat protein [Aphanothece sacrum]
MNKTPEVEELEQKNAELTLIETELIQKELELTTLHAELHTFELDYLQIVGNCNTADYWRLKGNNFFIIEAYEEAILAYDKALAIQPNDEMTWTNRAKILGKLNRYEDAIYSYDRVLEINPDNYEAWCLKSHYNLVKFLLFNDSKIKKDIKI